MGEFRTYFKPPSGALRLEGVIKDENNVPCPYVSLSGDGVDEYAKWILIESDIDAAIDAFKAALHYKERQEENSIVITRNLLFSAIVSYAKPFVQNRGRPVLLSTRKIFKLDPSCRKIHEKMIAMRQKYIAHNDRSEYQDYVIRAALNPDMTEKKALSVYHLLKSVAGFEDEEISKFLSTANIVRDFIKNKTKNMRSEILKEVNAMSPEKLYDNAVPVEHLYKDKNLRRYKLN